MDRQAGRQAFDFLELSKLERKILFATVSSVKIIKDGTCLATRKTRQDSVLVAKSDK